MQLNDSGKITVFPLLEAPGLLFFDGPVRGLLIEGGLLFFNGKIFWKKKTK
jgi:hypothetical protein